MKRIPEPELMLGEAQARAYAEADFSEPHNRFVSLFQECFPGEPLRGWVLDLGCGPADVTLRFARAFPQCRIHGIDGSESMLALGREAIRRARLTSRIELLAARLPLSSLPRKRYSVLISNSLLHHLRDPRVLWQAIARFSEPAAPVFVMDLMRPQNRRQARHLTDLHAAGETEILRHDFYHSLLAAYRPEEVVLQLNEASLGGFTVQTVSDRHFIVYGKTPPG